MFTYLQIWSQMSAECKYSAPFTAQEKLSVEELGITCFSSVSIFLFLYHTKKDSMLQQDSFEPVFLLRDDKHLFLQFVSTLLNQ